MNQILAKPSPSAGFDEQAKELEKCLEEQKVKDNYQRYVRWKKYGGEIDFLPTRMDIETVSRCNYACLMCTVSDWPAGKRAEDMDPEALFRLIEENPGVTEVKLTGLGEPLLQGDDFFKIVRFFRRKHVWVRVVSNASLFHINHNISKIIDSDINDLTISIDGASEVVFESIRRKSSFELVCRNVEMLHKSLLEAGKEITKAWCCVQEKNQEELEHIVELCAHIGFPELTFSLALHGWGRSDLLETNRIRTSNNTETVSEERIERLKDLANSKSIRLSFWDVSSKYSSSTRDQICPWPFERTVITSDFRLVPCCMIGNPDTFEL